MEEKLCYGCMEIKREHPICEHCGYDVRLQNDSHQLPQGTILQGHYLVGRVLGQGGFGITYLGLDLGLQRTVAIKEFYPGGRVTRNCTVSTSVTCTDMDSSTYERSKERFLREGAALAKFHHLKNIVNIFNLFPENNTVYLVMEYVEGSTLQARLMQNGPMKPEEIFSVLKPVMEDLQKIHEAQIIHRDISPDNIMLTPDGGARLLDFGAFREFETGDPEPGISCSTETILKQGFAPAEQYTSRGKPGPWTDVYALCATFCCCLSGEVPPPAPDRGIDQDPDGFIHALPVGEPLKAVLCQGMALRPKDRIGSAAELLSRLEKALKSEKKRASAPAAHSSPKTPSPKRRHPILWLLPVGAAVLLGLFFLLRSPGEAEPQKEVSVTETQAPESPETVALLPTGETVPEETIPEETWLEAPSPQVPFSPDLVLRNPDPQGISPYAFGTEIQKLDIVSIRFLPSLETAPENAVDVSQTGKGKVLLWAEATDMDNPYRSPDEAPRKLLRVNIAGDGKIFFPKNSADLFGDAYHIMGEESYPYLNLQKIRFNGAVDTSRVTNMSGMFASSPVTRLDLRCFDTSAVTDMADMFSNCSMLIRLDLSSFRTENVTDMSSMFLGCSLLSDLDLSSFDTRNVNSFFFMFCGCSKLRELDLTAFHTEKARDLSGMFSDCIHLNRLTLGEGFRADSAQHLDHMFYDCKDLAQLDLSGLQPGRMLSSREMFSKCSGLRHLDLTGFPGGRNIDRTDMFLDCGLTREGLISDQEVILSQLQTQSP